MRTIITALFLSVAPHHAQEADATPEMLASPIRISMLAIGDTPQPKFEIIDGKRVLMETPDTDHPPASLFLRQKKKDSDELKEVTLGLNAPTGYTTYQGEAKLDFIRTADDSDMKPYLSLTIPKLNADMTIILTRDRKERSWAASPNAKFLDNSLNGFPTSSVRFLNLSSVPVRILPNKAKLFELKPGETKILSVNVAEQAAIAYRVAAYVNDEIYPLADAASTFTAGARMNVVAYNADGDDRRNPVRVIRFFERPPQPPAKQD